MNQNDLMKLIKDEKTSENVKKIIEENTCIPQEAIKTGRTKKGKWYPTFNIKIIFENSNKKNEKIRIDTGITQIKISLESGYEIFIPKNQIQDIYCNYKDYDNIVFSENFINDL